MQRNLGQSSLCLEVPPGDLFEIESEWMPGPGQWRSVLSSRALLVLSVNFRET